MTSKTFNEIMKSPQMIAGEAGHRILDNVMFAIRTNRTVERASIERAAMHRHIRFIISEHLAIERFEIAIRNTACRLKSLLQHQLRAAADMLLHRFLR